MSKPTGSSSRPAPGSKARAKRYLEVASVVMFGGVVSTTLLSTARPNLLAMLTAAKGKGASSTTAAAAATSAAKLLGKMCWCRPDYRVCLAFCFPMRA